MMRIDMVCVGLLRHRLHRAIRIHRVTQLLRWLEEGNSLSRNIDLGPGLRVAAGSGISLAGPEASESANLDLVTGFQSSDDSIEEGIDDNLPVTAGQVSKSGHFINKVGFSHSGFLSYWGEGDRAG
jgi:hypothetical protein